MGQMKSIFLHRNSPSNHFYCFSKICSPSTARDLGRSGAYATSEELSSDPGDHSMQGKTRFSSAVLSSPGLSRGKHAGTHVGAVYLGHWSLGLKTLPDAEERESLCDVLHGPCSFRYQLVCALCLTATGTRCDKS